VLVLPEAKAFGLAVDDRLDAEIVEHLDLVGRGDNPDRDASAVQHVLDRVAPKPTCGAPHQDDVALLHRRGVVADEHPVRRGVAERVARRLFPCEMGGLRHELVGLDHRQVGEATKVGFKSPDALVGGEHGVVVGPWVLVVDVIAVDHDPIARFPGTHGRSHPDDNARGVGADHVIREIVPGTPLTFLAQT
jgi:hypothetical protein